MDLILKDVGNGKYELSILERKKKANDRKNILENFIPLNKLKVKGKKAYGRR